jgi:hypothetical protein
MGGADLDLLLTLDDPGEEEEGDALDHLEVEDTVIGNGPYPVVFAQGDWGCAISRMTFRMNDPIGVLQGNTTQSSDQKFEIDVCVITCSKNGKVVEKKAFYDLVGMQKQMGVS